MSFRRHIQDWVQRGSFQTFRLTTSKLAPFTRNTTHLTGPIMLKRNQCQKWMKHVRLPGLWLTSMILEWDKESLLWFFVKVDVWCMPANVNSMIKEKKLHKTVVTSTCYHCFSLLHHSHQWSNVQPILTRNSQCWNGKFVRVVGGFSWGSWRWKQSFLGRVHDENNRDTIQDTVTNWRFLGIHLHS